VWNTTGNALMPGVNLIKTNSSLSKPNCIDAAFLPRPTFPLATQERLPEVDTPNYFLVLNKIERMTFKIGTLKTRAHPTGISK
jgi:hypothetical protein